MAGRVPGGPRFVKKAGRFGVHLKGGSGTAPFRTIKIGISEEKLETAKKGQKSQIAPPGP